VAIIFVMTAPDDSQLFLFWQSRVPALYQWFGERNGPPSKDSDFNARSWDHVERVSGPGA
jgi:hypothetical protein